MNTFGVGANVNGQVSIVMPVSRMSREEALNLAAWLIVIAELTEDEIREAVASIYDESR
jgi:hypothetical protein